MDYDYVIEIQGFRDKDANFVPKEVAIVSLQEHIICHWVVLPPHEFVELPSSLRTANDLAASRHFGIHWFEGDITMRKLHYHLYNIARKAKRIYVKGREKARYIQSLMTRTVEDLDDYTDEGFTSLQKRFGCRQICSYHAAQEDTYKRSYCALLRAHVLRMWIYSHLADQPTEKLLEKGTDLFYQAIQNPLWHRRNNLVKFHDLAIGRDVVDKIDDDSDGESDTLEYESSEADSGKTQHEYKANNESPRRVKSPDNWRVRSGSDTQCTDDTNSNRV